MSAGDPDHDCHSDYITVGCVVARRNRRTDHCIRPHGVVEADPEIDDEIDDRA